MSKEELDRIFQQGAEQYDFEYNPAAWAHMERLLEERRRRRWILWCFWGGFGVVLLLFGWLFFPPSGDPDQPQGAPSPAAVPVPMPAEEVLPRANTAPGESQPGPRPAAPKIQTQDRERPVAARTPDNRQDEREEGTPLFQRDPAASPIETEPPAVDLAENDPLRTPAAEVSPPPSRLPATSLFPLPGKTILAVRERIETPVDVAQAPPTPTTGGSADHPSRLVLSAQVAPNYSSVGFGGELDRGGSVGIGLAYLLGEKNTIGLSFELSRKAYLAKGRDYTPPYGFWTRKIVPTETFGECTILEIPLNYTRYFGSTSRLGGFAQAGIASYLMLRESYAYRYDRPDPDLIRWWGARNDNQHWLSVINLAGGFRYPIGRKYALNLGPFLNIPLGGVGHGKVRLYSMGVNLRMDFQP